MSVTSLEDFKKLKASQKRVDNKAKAKQRDLLFLEQLKSFKLPVPKQEFIFHPPRKWRFDFSWPDYLIACEIEGGIWINGGHNRGSGWTSNMEKYNTAVLDGWKLVRVTPQMVINGDAAQLIKQLFQTVPLQKR